MAKIICVFCLALFACLPAWSAELVLKNGDHSKVFSSKELSQRPDAQTIQIQQDVAYQKAMTYTAVPLANVLKEMQFSAQDQVNFVALDGFVASLPAQLILQAKQAKAWLAVEPTTNAWPPLSNKSQASAGPFYLVWSDPQADKVTQEQWPYQIGRIEAVQAIAVRFPMLVPDKSIAENSPVQNGFAVFQKNCLACHKLNGGGESSIGPDLNIPHNPTEYFQLAYLKQLIRNPKQVRNWPDSKMPGFDSKTISDQELDNLIAYLQHMKKR